MTPKDIINQGLSKLGSSRVSTIDQPRQPLEHAAATGYPQWRDSELRKRRWLFATKRVTLTPSNDPIPDVERPYQFALPVDNLRIIRPGAATWEQRGLFLYDYGPTVTLDYVARVPDGEFDPLFVDVLACRVAMELVETATQSNTKAAKVKEMYDEAVAIAGQCNAYERGGEDMNENPYDSSWVSSRFGW